MGVVWRAEDERLARTVAVKQLLTHPGLSETQAEDARRRAMREARTAARLQHRNAISVFDVAEHDGNPWLILEFLRSRSLSVVLAEQGALPVDEVAKLGAQIASALAAAHDAGIVHRDVKPGNVLLDDDGLAKITDFGISRTIDDASTTQSGMVAGTPAYLAPEVARGQSPGRESDVFSLGATLYHAVEGHPPFGTNSNALALLHAVASGNVPPPRQAGPLTPVLMSMLAPEPADRPTMRGVAAALADAETRWIDEPRTTPVRPPVAVAALAAEPTALTPLTMGAPTKDLPVPVKPKGRTPSRLFLIAVLVLVFALAGVLTALIISSNKGSPAAAPPASTTGAPPRSSAPPSTSSPAAQVQGPIDWSSAGQLVIDFYAGMSNPASSWAKLSAKGQAVYGNEQSFQQYWSQYKQVSASHARGVTPNADGSVNVPVDVNYGTRQEHKVLRVTEENGKLAIDSDSR
jgi:eukaryotic-like serine/threonine-protein kinase